MAANSNPKTAARRKVVLENDGKVRQEDTAKQLGISQPAVSQLLNNSNPQYMDDREQLSWLRQEIDTELRELKLSLLDPTIRADRKIELALSIIDRQARLWGVDAPSRHISAHISGQQLDPLYLDIRAILQHLDEADQLEGFEVLKTWAASKQRPLLEGGADEDPYFS